MRMGVINLYTNKHNWWAPHLPRGLAEKPGEMATHVRVFPGLWCPGILDAF